MLAVLMREGFTLIPVRAIQLWVPAVTCVCLVIAITILPQIVLLVRRADTRSVAFAPAADTR